MSVGRICSREVYLIEPSERVAEAARRMKKYRVGTLIVIDDDEKPVGIVTDRDLALRVLAEGRDPEATAVQAVMTGDVRMVSAETPIESALSLMRSVRCRRLPVTDAAGAVVGIIAVDDILLLLAEEFHLLEALLERESPARADGE